MSSRISGYVTVVCIAALTSGLLLHQLTPGYSQQFVTAAFCFAALGVFANALSYRLARGASGGIGFIPFLTALILAPSWTTLVAVAISVTIVETLARRPIVKAAFNVAQYTLATAAATLIYLGLGGTPVLAGSSFSAPPYIAMFLVFLVINTGAVSGAVAIAEGRHPWQVWRENTLNTLVYDLLSLPIAALIAIVNLKGGSTGVIALAIPVLGVRQIYKANWQLEQINQDLLQLMVAAIEARDPYTSGHSRRVSQYAKIIARSLGMGTKQVERVGVAALLHDVGKIHEVYAPILRKPDRLTADEVAIMQTHPIKSAELVQNVSQLKDVVTSIRHHHENWDGTGYPDGIRGEDIPIASRIIMIADTIDAMTTDRPYRDALGEDDVRRELMRLRGKQFDEKICDVFLASPLYRLVFSEGTATMLSSKRPSAATRRLSVLG